jgi:hypothetical protein
MNDTTFKWGSVYNRMNDFQGQLCTCWISISNVEVGIIKQLCDVKIQIVLLK